MHVFRLKPEKNHPYYNNNKVNYQNKTKQKQQLIVKKFVKKTVNLQ